MDVSPQQSSGSPEPAQLVFFTTRHDITRQREAHDHYWLDEGKKPRGSRVVTLRDPLFHRDGITLNARFPAQRMVLELMDLPVVQRLKHIHQLGGSHFVYKDAEHSRFQHSLGSACLAIRVLEDLKSRSNRKHTQQIETFELPLVAAAFLHDLGHVAPRCHLGEKVWFGKMSGVAAKGQTKSDGDKHESLTERFIKYDDGLRFVLNSVEPLETQVADQVVAILTGQKSVPKWTSQLIFGGGWNVDRGDWALRDSIECGVTYGAYELAPLLKRLVLVDSGQHDAELCVTPEGVPLIENFFERRRDMYRMLYYHDVSRVAEAMYQMVGRRAREVYREGRLNFADDTMQAVLQAASFDGLSADQALNMIDPWWEYHLHCWAGGGDEILADLSRRIINREPFKHFENNDYNRAMLSKLLQSVGCDPEYYLLQLDPVPSKFGGDLNNALGVAMPGGGIKPLSECSDIIATYIRMEFLMKHSLLAMPVDPFYRREVH